MIGRRALLTMAASAALLGASGRASAARLRMFMLMRGALDSRIVIGGAEGSYDGVVDGEVTPLFNLVSATFARYRPAAGGGFEGATYEVPFFTDPATGALLEHWKNPYTGETVAVPQPTMPPARLLFTPDLTLKLHDAPPGLQLDHTVSPPHISGDDVWMVEQTAATIRTPGVAKPAHFTEIVTLHASQKALEAPHATRVPCQTGYIGIGGWRPWQKMGGRSGSLVGRGYGRYGLSIEELPAGWREMARARRPEILKNPDGPLAKLLAE